MLIQFTIKYKNDPNKTRITSSDHQLYIVQIMITIPDNLSEPTNTIKLIEDRLSKTKNSNFLTKCSSLIDEKNVLIENKLDDGQIKIRKKALHIESKPQEISIFNNNQNIKQKISSLNDDLKQLQDRIKSERKEKYMKDEEKRKEVNLMLERLKKDKDEHRNKIKFEQINRRLKIGAYSEEALNVMKEHKQKIVEEKRKNMELNIYKFMNRKMERQEENANNQIQYWVKVKEFQGKRHHSTKVLPKLSAPNLIGVNVHKDLIVVPRKGSLHKRSKSKHDLTDYQDIVNKYIERAQAKKNLSQRNIEESRLKNSKVISSQEENSKKKQIMLSYTLHKHKKLGDEYLKESLLRVQKSPKKPTLLNQSLEDSIELKGNAAHIFKNDILDGLQKRWEKILLSVKDKKIDKEKAIQMFGPVELRLDKIDPLGIENRLRRKLQTFEELKQAENSEQKQNGVQEEQTGNQQANKKQ